MNGFILYILFRKKIIITFNIFRYPEYATYEKLSPFSGEVKRGKAISAPFKRFIDFCMAKRVSEKFVPFVEGIKELDIKACFESLRNKGAFNEGLDLLIVNVEQVC